jgi:crotonobetainyl-CoA:carnitine CoA-transferase CaiB-like acyl-CoA transferase
VSGASGFALAGVVVADFSRVLAGPLLGMTLGDLGADVIKVEPPQGDDTRAWGPPFDDTGRATYFQAVNRNKRSIALNLKDAGDCRLARRLCERSDIVVSNFRPGLLERFELGHADVSPVAPGVIYCEISGFGEEGGRDLLGYDPLVQALGGLMSITGPPGAPSKTGVALVDIVAGLYGTVAILTALYERQRSGTGQRIKLNLLHTTLAGLANQATGWLGGHTVPTLNGNAHPSIEPFGTFRALDGELMICAGNDRQFNDLVSVLGVAHLRDDARFKTNAGRVEHRRDLRMLLEEALAAHTCGQWRELLVAARVPAGPVQEIPAAFAFAESLGLEAVDSTDGVRTVAFPASLSRTPAVTRLRPPDLDEHGDEIREWLGRDD